MKKFKLAFIFFLGSVLSFPVLPNAVAGPNLTQNEKQGGLLTKSVPMPIATKQIIKPPTRPVISSASAWRDTNSLTRLPMVHVVVATRNFNNATHELVVTIRDQRGGILERYRHGGVGDDGEWSRGFDGSLPPGGAITRAASVTVQVLRRNGGAVLTQTTVGITGSFR